MGKETEVDNLLMQATDVSGLLSDGIYTKPRSWGVYEIQAPRPIGATQRFRTGNHPIRQRELEGEFGTIRQIAVFVSKTQAETLKRLLNRR